MYTLLIICFAFLSMSAQEPKSVSKNGMTVSWIFDETGNIQFRLSAPLKGWVAIGINTEEQLVGSNLIMASVKGETLSISDKYVVGLGDPRDMEKLGAHSKASLISGQEDDAGTIVEFAIPAKSEDQYHFDLQKGKVIYLTMAFSVDDDFGHHSRMRTMVKVTL